MVQPWYQNPKKENYKSIMAILLKIFLKLKVCLFVSIYCKDGCRDFQHIFAAHLECSNLKYRLHGMEYENELFVLEGPSERWAVILQDRWIRSTLVRAPWRNGWFWEWYKEYIKWARSILWCQKNKEVFKKQMMGHDKGAEGPAERVPNYQRWNNLSNKIKYYWTIIQRIK